MFGQNSRTPFDVEFSLFGIPTRVHPFFWLFSILLGLSLRSPELIVIWVLCMFLSVLVHEMGHALVARAFGYWPYIVLEQFGGYAAYQPSRNHSLWKSIAITAAGPMAGFMFFGFLVTLEIVLAAYEVEVSRPFQNVIFFLQFMNFYWSLLNLLPILPLDGGQILRDLLLMIRRIDGLLWALRVSVVFGLAITVLFLKWNMTFAAIMFGLITFSNFQALAERNR